MKNIKNTTLVLLTIMIVIIGVVGTGCEVVANPYPQPYYSNYYPYNYYPYYYYPPVSVRIDGGYHGGWRR
jgi:hypothetical protein